MLEEATESLTIENEMLPEVDTGRKYWVPTPEENKELLAIEDQLVRTARLNMIFLAWRQDACKHRMPEEGVEQVTRLKGS